MAPRKLTIIQVNDVHGYLEPHPEVEWTGSEPTYPIRGGYGRIATLIGDARRDHPGSVIVLDNGDTFHGTYPIVQSRGEALVPILNAIGLDGMTGHWDFAYGPAQLTLRLVGGLNYPFLASNCTVAESGQTAFSPSLLLERGGVRVGVVGLAALVDKMMPDEFSTGLKFSLGIKETAREIEKLKYEEKAELIIVLSHLGFPQDVKLASEVAGIDILLSGHTHNRLYRPAVVNGTLLIQSGCHGSFVGRLDLEIDGRVSHVAHHLIPVDERIEMDPEIAAMISDVMDPHRDMLATTVGHAETPFDRGTILESSMDDLLLEAVAEASGTPLALSNGWRYGAPIVPGPITINDLWNMIPTNPQLTTVECTGREMRSMLEENLERTFARDPFDQLGGYVRRCRGLTMLIKIENPPGERIQQLLVEGAPIDNDRLYTVGIATPQAIPRRFGQNRRNVGCDAISALRSHLRRRPNVRANADRTVIAI